MNLRRFAILGAFALAAGCSQVLGLNDGKVQGACVANDDCAPDFACVSGQCRSACVQDDDCGGSLRCSNGYCTINSSSLMPEPAGGGGQASLAAPGGAGGGGSPSEPECEPNAQRCSSEEPQVPERCVDGRWQSTEACPFVCDAGECRGECEEDATRCLESVPQLCEDASWSNQAPCASLCRAGSCVSPPSCSGLSATCGGSESCCRALGVPGGEFKRSYDGVSEGQVDDSFTASVAPFLLDRYEVTVGRFRAFRNAYPASMPNPGAGKHPLVLGDGGWSEENPLPADQAALDALLACPDGTWTPELGPNEQRPISCLDFHLAYAFCIWDGGRLPTEAEWNFAAAGGEQQRVYPWADPPSATAISPADAVYSQTAGLPFDVGSSLPNGAGRWGHVDLAGNIWEWTLDWYVEPYATQSCENCANLTPTDERVVRGGAFLLPPETLLSGFRAPAPPDYADATFGVRCARDF